ncbi:ThiF family adenylyltransferase [Marinicella sp. W31]|uniref:tRNA threonylcarbamoyladenosine dehydratase n=1 Tax=Marinicella sp. W31 TaxID=3023713 RepID=UPI0037575F5D
MSDKQRFGGIERLYGESSFSQLQQVHVTVIGVGGVGCWSAEMLARLGVGCITLVDADDICVTNINRQLHALNSTVGQPKVEVMRQRILDINPDCRVEAQQQFFLSSTADAVLSNPGVVVDAIDSVKHKVELLSRCIKSDIPVVTAGGAGGKQDPGRIKMDDLSRTHGDRLLRKIRQLLRKELNLSAHKKIGIPAVFSDEEMKLPFCDVDRPAVALDCDTGYGTSPIMISSMGIQLAQLAFQQIMKSTS